MAQTHNYMGEKPVGHYSAMDTQRTYSMVSNEGFYALVPHPYRTYYRRFVQEALRWYDGYVPWFHTQQGGIFSTKLAFTVIHKLARLISGGKMIFDNGKLDQNKQIKFRGKEYGALDFIEMLSSRQNWSSKSKIAMEYAMAAGDSLLKLDNVNGEIKVDVFRKDGYFFSTDFRGEITDATIFLTQYTQVNTESHEELFYLLEERRYNENGKPQVRLTAKKGTAHNIYQTDLSLDTETMKWQEIPGRVRKQIKKDYPSAQLGVWKDLPLKNLGVFVVKNTEKVSFMPSLPYGESILHNSMSILMSYDYYFSAMNTDLYTGRARVLMPKPMQAAVKQQKQQFSGFDDYIMQKVSYTDPKNQKPEPIQFDLRAQDWKEIRNILLQTLSTNLGVNERTIANYLVPSAEKPTAHEISSEENDTTALAEEKRVFLKNAWDLLIETVLDFYGIGDQEVEVRFSRAGLTNFANVVQQVTVLRNHRLVDLWTAIGMIFFDKSNKEKERIYYAIKEEEKSQEQVEEITDLEKEDEKYYSRSLSQVEQNEEEQ